MRVALLLCCFALFMQTDGWAQATERKIEFQKTLLPAAVIEVPYGTDVVEDAMHGWLTQKGYKTSSYKGFTVARSIKMDSSLDELSDVYFKVEHRNHQKDVSVVTLIPTKVNEDILVAGTNGNPKIETAKQLLDRITPYIESHNTNVQLKDQEEVVKKAQKKMNGLKDDQTDYEKKLRNLQADLDQNKKDQVKQNSVLQTILPSDDDGLKKAQKKKNKLMDEQGDLEKKIRKTQSDIEENKQEQRNQQQELDKQTQILQAIKSKQL